MSMQYVRQRYGVPAKRGGRVKYNPIASSGLLTIYGDRFAKFGTIKSAKNGHLRILLDGDKKPGIYHPTWHIQYLDS